MCGLVGAFRLNKTDLEIEQKLQRAAMLFLHNEVLYRTVKRGKHATGVSISLGKATDPKVEGGDIPFWAILKVSDSITQPKESVTLMK